MEECAEMIYGSLDGSTLYRADNVVTKHMD